jgi:hypothetical protein
MPRPTSPLSFLMRKPGRGSLSAAKFKTETVPKAREICCVTNSSVRFFVKDAKRQLDSARLAQRMLCPRHNSEVLTVHRLPVLKG